MTTLDDPNQHYFGVNRPPAKISEAICVVAICQQRSWSININDGRENHRNHPKTILSWLCTQSGTWFFPHHWLHLDEVSRPMTYMELRFGDTWSIWRRDAPHWKTTQKACVFLWFVACSHSCTVQKCTKTKFKLQPRMAMSSERFHFDLYTLSPLLILVGGSSI